MRKAWRVDIKWIFGIIFTLSVFIAINCYFLASLSSLNMTSAGTQGSDPSKQYSAPGFLTNPLEQTFQKAKENPQEPVEVVGIGKLDITGRDINDLSPDQAAKEIEKAIERKAKKMSNEDIDKMMEEIPMLSTVQKFTEDPAKAISSLYGQKGLFSGMSPLMLASPVYEGFFRSFMGLGIFFAIIGLIGLLVVSYRSGKLVSPGIGLMIASFPGMMGYLTGKSYASIAGPDAASAIPFASPLTSFLVLLADKGLVFPITFGFGFFMVFVGLIVGIIVISVRPKTSQVIQPQSSPQASEQPTVQVVPQEKKKPGINKKTKQKNN